MAFEGGDIFIDDLDQETEMLIEGNCWALTCALFSSLSGDLHHGSSQYLIEGVRIALTKYGRETKLRIFRDKKLASLLNYQLLSLGFITRAGDYKREFEHIDKGLLEYLPEIKKEYIKEDDIGTMIPYSFKKLGSLYFVLDFITRVNDIMSRMEADPIGTLMFDTLKKFKKYAKRRFIELKPKEIIDYQELFNEFLNEPENEEIKKNLINYQNAKVISYFDVNTMLEIGENEQIEFKREVTQDLYKAAISFSNTTGGKILVGITDEKEVLGLDDVYEGYRQSMDIILGNTNPKISPIITSQKLEGKDILVIEIHPFSKVVEDNKNISYVRKGDKNCIASKLELIKLFKEREGLLSELDVKGGPTLESIRKKVLDSKEEDWSFDDGKGIYTYKGDINLVLKREMGEEFYEKWMDVFPDKRGVRSPHEIFYGGSFIEKIYVVEVDGGRCYIPYPDLKNKTINEYQYKIGKIINYPFEIDKGPLGSKNFDSYLRRANIKVV